MNEQISAPAEDSMSDDALREAIDIERLPSHIAVIMDGNGRWAKHHQFSRIKGHKAGIPAVQSVVAACIDLKIKVLTLYAFSTENWKRPAQETGTLMALLRQYLRMEIRTVRKHDVRVRAIGDTAALSPGIQKDLQAVIDATRDNQGMCFNIALNYSGRHDIVAATRRILASGIDPDTLDEQRFAQYLSTSGQPDPDLVIRTSGEYRVSNFLLWQIAYSEIWVTPILWPDFRKRHLFRAILDYQARNRRFGGI